MDHRKSSCATVVPPNNNHELLYENSIADVTTITSNPTFFKKLKTKLLQRHDTQFDEELQKQSNKRWSIKNSRGWMAAMLMILVGVLIAITFILVGLGKSLTTNNNNNHVIETNSTTTTITITTTLTTPTST